MLLPRGRSAAAALLLVLYFVLYHGRHDAVAQLSKPIAHDDNMKDVLENNKFVKRDATDDSKGYLELDEDALSNTQCPQFLEMRWQTEVGSSVYASPLIADINGDGKLEVVVSTFVHYLEVLDGSDGDKLSGWPAQHQSTVHASPLLYDIDNDGFKEIALANFNGEVVFFRSGGYLLPEKLTVPRLRVRKNWYEGLDPDHVDRRTPDVHDGSLVEDSIKQDLQKEETKNIQKEQVPTGDGNLANGTTVDATDDAEKSSKNVTISEASTVEPSQSATNDTAPVDGSSESVKSDIVSETTTDKNNTVPNLNDKVESKVESTVKPEGLSTGALSDILANSNAQSQQASVKRRLLQEQTTTGNVESAKTESKVENAEAAKTSNSDSVPTVEDPEDPMEEDALASFDVFRDEDENGEDELTEEYDYDYDDYVNEMWGDEDWDELPHEKMEEYVEVDSHILCTPVIADIDNDGVDEMVVAASYFYDREYYEIAKHAKELGENFDLGKYVAGAIVVFNLKTKQVKWQIQLDLSTDTPTYRAYIYSPPTVVDLDGDGYQEIIVGTSMGFLYAFHHNGTLKKNFPLLMGEIQGQVVAADINDDGKIEIVTGDSKGNVAAWTGEGKELWEVHLRSLISQGVTVGDVDGDGHTDLVVPTTSGNIYVLRGSDGSNVGPFPFRTHGRVMSPALLVDLSRRGGEKKGLTIAIGSFDGYFYLIDGTTGCADAIDIGETSYSMALADNVDGGDDLDIIVTTMNGNVYCFQTPAPHHPLKAWSMQTQGRNVFSSRYQREGIFVLPSSREFRDEAGDRFHVTFEIVDKHLVPPGNLGPYRVMVTMLTPANYRGDKKTWFNYTYEQPGVYTVTLPCMTTRISGTVMVEMFDKNSLYFSDEFALTFHMRYHRLLKWLLTLPFLGMTGMFLVLRPQDGAPLPSFTRERHQL